MAKVTYNIGEQIGPNGNKLLSKERRTTSGGNKIWYGTFQCAHPGCENTFESALGKVQQGKRKYCREHAKASVEHPCKYAVGDRIGPHDLEILDIDYTDKKNPRGTFKCRKDDVEFKALLYPVANGTHSGLCPDCAHNDSFQYKNGTYVGDHGLFLIRRCEEDNTRGHFRCTCGREFTRSVSDVAKNKSKSCDECRHRRYSKERTGKAMPSKYQVGDRFGDNSIELLAFDHHEPRKGWFGEFQCPYCDNTFIAQISQVANNRKKTCGKHSKEIRKTVGKKNSRDITNMKFGRLTAIEQLDEKDETSSSYIWKCLCDCQLSLPEKERTYTYRSASYLLSAERAGRRQSCGCWSREISSANGLANAKDLTGQRFGYLEPLFRDGTATRGTAKNTAATWTCLCHNCGNEVSGVISSDLTSGNRISCGECQVSKGEMTLFSVLAELKIPYEAHRTFDTCRNPETGYMLIFDCYLPVQNILVEYDGIQHYQPDSRQSAEQFAAANARDVLKNTWCAANGIPLIRIPYTELPKLDAVYLSVLIDKAAETGGSVFVPFPTDVPDERPVKF